MPVQVRNLSANVLGVVFVLIGIDHFLRTAWYEPIVPELLGRPDVWVYLSGVAEIAFGALLLMQKHRRLAAKAIMAMLVVLYWANLNMWVNDIPLNGVRYGTGWHIGRLSVQLLLIGFFAWIADLLPTGDSDVQAADRTG
jgi:uncharacterized membrane protein